MRKEKGSKVSLRAKEGKILKKGREKVETEAQFHQRPRALLHPSPAVPLLKELDSGPEEHV